MAQCEPFFLLRGKLCELYTYTQTHTNCMRTHLECLVPQVHFEQRVSHQVSEATAIEITVWFCVIFFIVDLRELQATVLFEVVSMEILMLAEHLWTKGGSNIYCHFLNRVCISHAVKTFVSSLGFIVSLRCSREKGSSSV